jgi:serine/threonine-protein kinase
MTEATRSMIAADGIPTATESHPDRIGRYLVVEEIARGGMGIVLRVTDTDLDRTLALKLLQQRHAAEPTAVRRFLDEARLCGQLQHPGIPPVHELGTLPDGRPFFAMKLVKGDTLAHRLARRTTPAHDLPEFVRIFEQVCQTVSYAHSRGVLHRDLKPLNVMVGAFGEVQVMDWGLAKLLRGPGESSSPTVVTADISTICTTQTAASPEETVPGSILGTPAFMSPEQARGQVDHLDERADVYALGAILCVILTGRPPHEGSDTREVLRRTAEGDLTPVRDRLARGVDPELASLCLACLAFQPCERPRDAAAVAQAVSNYRAGVEQRLRQTEIARAQAEVRAGEERVRRRMLLAWVASALLFVLALGAATWWWQSDRQARLSQTQAEVTALLGRADQQQQEATTATTERRAMFLRRARGLIEQAETAITAGLADDALRRQVAEARQSVDAELEQAEQQVQQSRREATFLAALGRARDQRMVQVALDWAENEGAALQFARAFVDYGRDATTGTEAETAAWLRSLPDTVREPALLALYEWWECTAFTQYQSVRDRLWRVLKLADDDPWRQRFRAAVESKDVAQFRRMAAEARQRPPAAFSCVLLANRLVLERAREEAIELLRVARLAHPGDVEVPTTLAHSLFWGENPTSSGANLEEAAGCYRIVLALRPDSYFVYQALALVLLAQNKLPEAVATMQKSVDLDPSNREENGYGLVARAIQLRKKPDEALTAYRQLVERETENSQAQAGLGRLLGDQGKPDEARAALATALRLDPNNAFAHFILAGVARQQGRLEEAIASFRKVLTLNPDALRAQFGLAQTLWRNNQRDEALTVRKQALEHLPTTHESRSSLALFLIREQDADGALSVYEKILETMPLDAEALRLSGVLLVKKKELDRAEERFRKLATFDPAGPYYLGKIALSRKDTEGAIAAFRKQIAQVPMHGPARIDLAEQLLKLGRVGEARAVAEQTLQRLPTEGQQGALRQRAQQQLKLCDHLRPVESRLPDLLAKKTKLANVEEARILMEFCAGAQKRYAAAVDFFEDGVALDPKWVDDLATNARYNAACFAVLAATGQGEDAPPEDSARSELRARALRWLRADLDARAKALDTGKEADRQALLKMMEHWQKDADLASTRGNLPTEAERRDWSQLWADVESVRKKASAPDK